MLQRARGQAHSPRLPKVPLCAGDFKRDRREEEVTLSPPRSRKGPKKRRAATRLGEWRLFVRRPFGEARYTFRERRFGESPALRGRQRLPWPAPAWGAGTGEPTAPRERGGARVRVQVQPLPPGAASARLPSGVGTRRPATPGAAAGCGPLGSPRKFRPAAVWATRPQSVTRFTYPASSSADAFILY